VIHDRLELVELLGSGSMGQVYRANHRTLQKSVAIKVMRPEVPPTEEQVLRFEAEARSTSRIDHPNCVQILDFGRDGADQLLYIAMEFLDGEPLSKLIKRDRQLDPARATRIMLQALAALAAAHDQNIVHRDVKPTNVMLVSKTGDDGVLPEYVKVCDFGIAKLLKSEGDTPPLTMQGVSLGTPAYSAPEQIMGMPVDGRADLYACGVVMYLMLTGRRPFTGEVMEVAMKQVSEAPAPIASLRPGLDPGLIAIVERAMAKRAEERFADAREMRNALKPFLGASRESNSTSIPSIPLPYPAESTVPPQVTPPPPFHPSSVPTQQQQHYAPPQGNSWPQQHQGYPQAGGYPYQQYPYAPPTSAPPAAQPAPYQRPQDPEATGPMPQPGPEGTGPHTPPAGYPYPDPATPSHGYPPPASTGSYPGQTAPPNPQQGYPPPASTGSHPNPAVPQQAYPPPASTGSYPYSTPPYAPQAPYPAPHLPPLAPTNPGFAPYQQNPPPAQRPAPQQQQWRQQPPPPPVQPQQAPTQEQELPSDRLLREFLEDSKK